MYMEIYPSVLAGAAQWKKVQMSGQIDLFGMGGPEESEDEKDPLPDIQEWDEDLKLMHEKEVLGLYLSGHPLAKYENAWRRHVTHYASDFVFNDEENGENAVPKEHPVIDGAEATIGGIILHKTVKTTKNNKMMAFLTVEDLYGQVEVLVFPNSYEQFRPLMEEDMKVYITGRISVQEDEDSKIILRDIITLDENEEAEETKPKTTAGSVWLRFVSNREWQALKEDVIGCLSMDPGERSVRIYLETEKKKLKAPEVYNVSGSDFLKQKLSQLIGEKNVVF